MEHINKQSLGNGYYRLTPDEGYILTYEDHTYTEADVENTDGWGAVPV